MALSKPHSSLSRAHPQTHDVYSSTNEKLDRDNFIKGVSCCLVLSRFVIHAHPPLTVDQVAWRICAIRMHDLRLYKRNDVLDGCRLTYHAS